MAFLNSLFMLQNFKMTHFTIIRITTTALMKLVQHIDCLTV